jgi:phosphoglycolate phosphatase
VLVGDTPLDVAAGRSAGARVVGVATGPHSVDELVEARAEPVLSDLRDTEAVLEAVLGARPEAVAR